MDGYCAIGRDFIDTRPAMTMISEMTIAKIGRSMKNLENTDSSPPLAAVLDGVHLPSLRRRLPFCGFPFRRGSARLHRDLDARVQRQHSVHHDPFTRPEALRDKPVVPIPV